MNQETKETKPEDYNNKLKGKLIVLFAFFILTLMSGVYAMKYPSMIGLCVIFLAFLLFNGFNILVNLIIKSTRTIVKDGIL